MRFGPGLRILSILIFYVSDGFTFNVAILPGTKWCGKGDEASSVDDLGVFELTDNCCREHDMCPDSIPAESWEHDLYNADSYSKSHCDCDQKFYDCLKNAGTPISLQTGQIYFNILQPQCFNQTSPIINCAKKKRRKCIKYNFDTTAEHLYWQWFDNPRF